MSGQNAMALAEIEPSDLPGGPTGKNRHTENFPVGSFLIRADLRTHVHAFYNFARAADDISDDPLMEPQEKIRRLNNFAAVLRDERMQDIPSAVKMRESLKATGVTPQHCLDLLAAFKRDATQLRYSDWADLMDYCRYSASPVGRHVLALHGIGESAWPSNDALCSALQVINHIQDIADDYRELDRVYIPQDMLAHHGGRTVDLSKPKSTEGLRATLNEMLDRCDDMMIEAHKLPRNVPALRLKCEVSIIGVLADKLIRLLRRRDPLYADVKLSKFGVTSAAVIGVVRAWR
jgi:squalene synthase HpnC